MLTNTTNANSSDMPIPAQSDPGAHTGDSVMNDSSGTAAMTRLKRLKAATTELTVAASEVYKRACSDGGMLADDFAAVIACDPAPGCRTDLISDTY
jgi:hypothetical protein